MCSHTHRTLKLTLESVRAQNLLHVACVAPKQDCNNDAGTEDALRDGVRNYGHSTPGAGNADAAMRETARRPQSSAPRGHWRRVGARDTGIRTNRVLDGLEEEVKLRLATRVFYRISSAVARATRRQAHAVEP